MEASFSIAFYAKRCMKMLPIRPFLFRLLHTSTQPSAQSVERFLPASMRTPVRWQRRPPLQPSWGNTEESARPCLRSLAPCPTPAWSAHTKVPNNGDGHWDASPPPSTAFDTLQQPALPGLQTLWRAGRAGCRSCRSAGSGCTYNCFPSHLWWWTFACQEKRSSGHNSPRVFWGGL